MSQFLRNATVLGTWLLLTYVQTSISEADLPSPVEKESSPTFEFILDQISDAESSRAWQTPGWKAPVSEKWLSNLVAQVATATNRDFLKLPIRFDDVNVDVAGAHRERQVNSLLVIKNGKIPHIRKSIILSDGSVSVSFANDSIIIARGSVDVSHGNRNVIISGEKIHVSHDGRDVTYEAHDHGLRRSELEDFPMKHGSLIMSGGSVDLSHAWGSVCSAPQSATIRHAHQVVYMNTPNRKVEHDYGRCIDVVNARIPTIIVPLSGKSLR